MSTQITTSDILPFAWGGYEYRAKKELPIECCQSPIFPEYTIVKCDLLEWGTYLTNDEDKSTDILDFRKEIRRYISNYLMASDEMLTDKDLRKKAQLVEYFEVIKL